MPIPSLFWRLYLGILIAFGFLLLIVSITFIYQEDRTAIDDFYADSKNAAKAALYLFEQNNYQKLTEQELTQLSHYFYFHIELLDKPALLSQLSNFERLTSIDSTDIYENIDSGGFASLQKIKDSIYWLLISDISEESNQALDGYFQNHLEQERREEALPIYLLLGSVVVIALILLLFVRHINQYLKQLSQTSKKWAQGELTERANVDIPQPLSELAVSFNYMASALDRKLVEQQVMANAMSHELRTPLSKIQLAYSLLIRKHQALSEEPLLEDLSRFVDELELLVNEFLTLAKINHLEVSSSKSYFDLTALSQERAKEFRLLNPEKTILVNTHESIKVDGDIFYLQIALDNLLKNACKYSKQKVRVNLVIEGNSVKISVEDDGCGVCSDQRQGMLVAFSRLDDSRNKNNGGFGLGLAIVQAIIQQHKGNIELLDSELGGLQVLITLPTNT